MIIRPAIPADITDLPEIERSSGDAFLGTEQAWIAGDTVTPAEAYPERVSMGLVLVAEAEGAVRGFVDCELSGEDLHVLQLSTTLDWQGRGVGSALMRAALDLGRSRGVRRAVLTTFRSIPWNAPFYERLGFAVLERPDHHLTQVLAAEAARGMTDRCAMACLIREPGRA